MPKSHKFQWEITRHSKAFKQCGMYFFTENGIKTALKMYIGLNKKFPKVVWKEIVGEKNILLKTSNLALAVT